MHQWALERRHHYGQRLWTEVRNNSGRKYRKQNQIQPLPHQIRHHPKRQINLARVRLTISIWRRNMKKLSMISSELRRKIWKSEQNDVRINQQHLAPTTTRLYLVLVRRSQGRLIMYSILTRSSSFSFPSNLLRNSQNAFIENHKILAFIFIRYDRV